MSETTAYLKDVKRYYCVELPCFVESTGRAMSMLGGEQHTLATLQREDDSTLSLQFPNDHSPFSNGIKGSALERKAGLLIKITRKKKKTTNQSTPTQQSTQPINTKVEILGFVEKTWTFSEPADYQVRKV
jgi:hypothetical protein